MAETTQSQASGLQARTFRLQFLGYGRFRPISRVIEREASTLEAAIRSVEKAHPELFYAGCAGMY